MRHLIPSLIVLASVVSANVGAAAGIPTQSPQESQVSSLSPTVTVKAKRTILRPSQTQSRQFSRSTQSSLLSGQLISLKRSSRPVQRLPQKESAVRLPTSGSRLLGSTQDAVHSPAAAPFRPIARKGKLQRRR
jgi:hypothetical protein